MTIRYPDPREKLTQYERGEWDMFNLITSVEYGKQRYFLQDDPDIVYDRDNGEYSKRETIYTNYIKTIEW